LHGRKKGVEKLGPGSKKGVSEKGVRDNFRRIFLTEDWPWMRVSSMKGIDVFIYGGGLIALVLAGLLVSRAWEDSERTGRSAPTIQQSRVSADIPRIPSSNTRPNDVTPPSAGKLFYAYNEALPSGYRCSAADGYVVKTSKQPDGSTSIELLQRNGQVVRCGGDARSSHRY
jgi:hypothetical protein